ncbi:MAG: hypothetical protein QXJ18_01950 [Desulfurococcaceae archaeon]
MNPRRLIQSGLKPNTPLNPGQVFACRVNYIHESCQVYKDVDRVVFVAEK